MRLGGAVRTWFLYGGGVGFGDCGSVGAGLVLSAIVVCLSWLIFLPLLATARGGASFLCPKRQRNEAKKALLTALP